MNTTDITGRRAALLPNTADAGEIARHYQPDGRGVHRVPVAQGGQMTSYVRNCAFAMMVVNCRWPWALAAPLHYDVYIGIDVLHNMAGLTFVYGRGRQIYFHHHRSKQAEKLTTPQLRQVVAAHLREHFKSLRVTPRSIVVHRDGRAYASEIAGIHQAVRDLQREGLLPLDVTLGVVDIRKSTTDHLRLTEVDTWTSGNGSAVSDDQAGGRSARTHRVGRRRRGGHVRCQPRRR